MSEDAAILGEPEQGEDMHQQHEKVEKPIVGKILVTSKLTKVFEKRGNEVHALNDVNLEIAKGDYIALQGPSGSGKTTLLNMLGGLDCPSNGKVVVDEIDLTDVSQRKLAKIRAHKIGFVFQTFNLLPILNALENVMLPMELKKMYRSDREDRAVDLLGMVGLSDRMLHKPSEMSGGEQQRVAIARALANEPAIILADEPTGNLDTKTGKQIMDILGKLNKELGTTLILVTHDNQMAKRAKTIIHLKDGRVSSQKDESQRFEVVNALDLPDSIIERLARGGYDTLEKILAASKEDIQAIHKIKRKDVAYILFSIEEYKEANE
jgi:putative ABC transport system ATP-binding protein